MADLRGELTDLVHSYAHHTDAFEIDAFIGLFAEGKLIDLPQEQLSLPAFRVMMEQNQRDTQGLALLAVSYLILCGTRSGIRVLQKLLRFLGTI